MRPVRSFTRHAIAAAFVATSPGCSGEAVAPKSDELMISGTSAPGLGYAVFELDSMQFVAAFSGGPRLRPGEVTWSVNGRFATVSGNGLATAIRATDFDLPSDPSSSQRTITATAGTRTATQILPILGWEKPRLPALDGMAYLRDERSFGQTFPLTLAGIDKAGEPFGGTGELIVSCGTVVPGRWTVEISPDDVDFPLTDPGRKLFSTDTVLVVFEGEAARLERWQPVGLRLRAPDGDDMMRQMRKTGRLFVTARSYSVVDPSVKFQFRLGNVHQVVQAAAFRACT